MKSTGINCLFLDIGGVLLTNGWDRSMRMNAARTFKLDYAEIDERHHLTFDTYEEGKLSLDEYLKRVIFYENRNFTPAEFKNFMFQQSRPFPETIDLIRNMKKKYNLKTVAVSNEGRELTAYRNEKFGLGEMIDSFVISSFIHIRKPDPDIFRIALDIAQAQPSDVLYIEDRAMFIEVAETLGITGIHHTDLKTTMASLEEAGLSLSREKNIAGIPLNYRNERSKS